jgi:hypothetical protein
MLHDMSMSMSMNMNMHMNIHMNMQGPPDSQPFGPKTRSGKGKI